MERLPTKTDTETGCIIAGDDPAAQATAPDGGNGIVGGGGGGGGEAPAAKEKKGLTPLPREEVERVLSWRREHLTSGNSTAEEIQAFEELNDSIAEYQAWMRAEFEANGGVVLVDDEFFRERDEFDRLLVEFMGDEEEDDFDFSGWNISNLRCDFYNDESEEEEDEEEGEKGADELDAG